MRLKRLSVLIRCISILYDAGWCVQSVWLLIRIINAGFIKLFEANPAIGFMARAKKYGDTLAIGQVH